MPRHKNRIKCMRPVNKKRNRHIATRASSLISAECKLCEIQEENNSESSSYSSSIDTIQNNITNKRNVEKPKKIIFLKSTCIPGGSYIRKRFFLASKVYNYLKRLNKQWMGAFKLPKGNQMNCVDKFKQHNSNKYLKDRVRKNIFKGNRPGKSGKYFSKIKKIKKKNSPNTVKKIAKIVAESIICGLTNGILRRDGYNFTLNREYRSVFDLRIEAVNSNIKKDGQATAKNNKKVRPIHSIEMQKKTNRNDYDSYSGSSKSTVEDESSSTGSGSTTNSSKSSTSLRASTLNNKRITIKKPNRYCRNKKIKTRRRQAQKKKIETKNRKKNEVSKYKLDTLYFPEKRIKLRKDLILKNVKVRKRKTTKKRKHNSATRKTFKYQSKKNQRRKRAGSSRRDNSYVSNRSYAGATSISSYSCRSTSSTSLKSKNNSCTTSTRSRRRKCIRKPVRYPKKRRKSRRTFRKLPLEESSELNLTQSFQKMLEQKKKSKRHKMLSFIYKIRNWIKYQHLIGPWFSGNKRLTSTTRSIKNSLSRSSKMSRSVSTKSCLLCNMKSKGRQHGNYRNKSIDSISLFNRRNKYKRGNSTRKSCRRFNKKNHDCKRCTSPEASSAAGARDNSHDFREPRRTSSKSCFSDYGYNKRQRLHSSRSSSHLEKCDSFNNEVEVDCQNTSETVCSDTSSKMVQTKDEIIQTSFRKLGKRKNSQNFDDESLIINKRRRKRRRRRNKMKRKRKRESCSPNSCRPRSKLRKKRDYCNKGRV